MNRATTSDVIVVGGGIGGLGAALGLSRQGLHVTVYESSPEFGEVGAGLQIAPNGTRVLDQYGLLDEVRRHGVSPDAMVMLDAIEGTELTRLDLRDLEHRYGYPYLVTHRSDLHGALLRACQDAEVKLLTDHKVTEYENIPGGARVHFESGSTASADIVIAADGLHSTARRQFVGDRTVNSAYVAYRGAVPIEQARDNHIFEDSVVVYVGPRCHFVQYPLRGGEMFNQVAVFESPKALAGMEDWGTPDELDHAFDGTCQAVQDGLPLMWRDRRWRMYDRDPIRNWVYGNVVLLGDAAHPPLQYIAQGAIMALEDGWVLAEHVSLQQRSRHRPGAGVDWREVTRAYNEVRPAHCERVQLTSRKWGRLWHHDGAQREQRNLLLRARDTYDYTYTDWLYGPTALTTDQEPRIYPSIALGAESMRSASR
ncbi:FAD-dependent monooxygenase [Streptomyces sp. NPDC101234]|uniref:FAD-dependent monooxygenase n=1 Tax=Streptomyces sp. NPDC101234 TaxID=3366138 RepID=UPI0037FC8EB7